MVNYCLIWQIASGSGQNDSCRKLQNKGQLREVNQQQNLKTSPVTQNVLKG